MVEFSRDDKIKLFLVMANELPAGKDTVYSVFDIVMKYDVPSKTDRTFIYDCLIAYFSDREEYEKCAELLRLRNSAPKKIHFDKIPLTRDEAINLRMMGFQLPDRASLEATTITGSSAY
jgi:hypothetical protein